MSAEGTATLEPHDILADRYEIVRKIAEGGMGAIYLGRQIELGRTVAIKTLRPDLSGKSHLVTRFRKEVEAVKRLTHPNTVRIYDFGTTDSGQLYLVMEYLEGQTIDEILRATQRLTPSVVIETGRQVLKSLVEAHAQGIVHRDIKPSNLMLCHQLGEVNFVKVLDFGLAIDSRTDDGAEPGRGTMGTPNYMSPEQVRHEALDARSDLYSLGLTLFEMAVGRPAYSGNRPVDIARRHLDPSPLVLPIDLADSPLGRVIERASRKSRAQRYQSAGEMLKALAKEGDGDGEEEVSVLALMGSSDRVPQRSFEDAVSVRAPTEDMTRMLVERMQAPRRRRVRRFALALALPALVGAYLAIASDGQPPASPPENLLPSPAELAESAAATVGQSLSQEVAAHAQTVAPRLVIVAAEHEDEETAEVEQRGVHLVVTSEPAGALVTLDGADLCRTPCESHLTSPGESGRLRVSLDGYASIEHTVDLTRDVSVPVTLVRRRSRRAAGSDPVRRRPERSDPATAAAEPANPTEGPQIAPFSGDSVPQPSDRRTTPVDF